MWGSDGGMRIDYPIERFRRSHIGRPGHGSQGANRLAGNALAETFVFGTIAGHEAASNARHIKAQVPDRREIKREMEDSLFLFFEFDEDYGD